MGYALELKSLCKHYGDFSLNHIDFSLPTGCIMGLIGENGAGKSTTIKLILDLIKKDSGKIRLFGQDSTNVPPHLKEQIGVVLDQSSFPETLSANQINKVLKKVYHTWEGKKFLTMVQKFQIPLKKQVKDYSKGMKMKLSIAVALSHNTKLLILDEATSGIDPVVRDELLDLFLEFIQDDSHSILMSSHIIGDLEKVCDYITFIHHGKMIFSESKDDLLEQYRIVKCSVAELKQIDANAICGKRENQFGVETLVKANKIPRGFLADPANIEDIMLFTIRGEQ